MPPVFSREIVKPTVSSMRLLFQARTSPCEADCPAGNPIQAVQALIAQGNFDEALRFLRARNPFSGTTGRVCTRRCELKCNRGRLDEVINIRSLERRQPIMPTEWQRLGRDEWAGRQEYCGHWRRTGRPCLCLFFEPFRP